MASSGRRHAILPAGGDEKPVRRAPCVAGRGSNPGARPRSQETPSQRGMRRSKRYAALRPRACPLLLGSDANSSRAVWKLPTAARSTEYFLLKCVWRHLLQIRSTRPIEPNDNGTFFLNRV